MRWRLPQNWSAGRVEGIEALLNPGNFDFFTRFFLAGFIFYSVRSLDVLGEKPKATETVFESVVLSLLNQLVFLTGFVA